MMKKEEAVSSTKKVSLPAKVIDLLWSDDEFYREVVSSKKITLDKFPKTDQWVDDNGFHMEFALAGYSEDDVRISTCDNYLYVESSRSRQDDIPNTSDGVRSAKPKITYGSIVRGIARRNFRSKIVISSDFNIVNTTATMSNGLLHILIPKSTESEHTVVKIRGV